MRRRRNIGGSGALEDEDSPCVGPGEKQRILLFLLFGCSWWIVSDPFRSIGPGSLEKGCDAFTNAVCMNCMVELSARHNEVWLIFLSVFIWFACHCPHIFFALFLSCLSFMSFHLSLLPTHVHFMPPLGERVRGTLGVRGAFRLQSRGMRPLRKRVPTNLLIYAWWWISGLDHSGVRA